MLTYSHISAGALAVVWKRDNIPVNSSTYEQSRRLVNAESATYESTLSSDDVTNFVGTFTCEVRNTRGTVEKTVELNGIFIDCDQFSVGQSATVKCFSDFPAIIIEWFSEENLLLASATSTQQLDLGFCLVNDSISAKMYTCKVTGIGGMMKTEAFTANVAGNDIFGILFDSTLLSPSIQCLLLLSLPL